MKQLDLDWIKYPPLSNSSQARSIAKERGWVGLGRLKCDTECLDSVSLLLKVDHFAIDICAYNILCNRREEIQYYLDKGKKVSDKDWYKHKLDKEAWFDEKDYKFIKTNIKLKKAFSLPTPTKVKYHEVKLDERLDFCAVGFKDAVIHLTKTTNEM